MAFVKKVWKDRIAEYINRRLLTNEDGSQELVTVARNEGNISQAFNAANMNDLEDRIANEFQVLNEGIKRVYGYHASGESLTLNNVAKGSIIFIKGSGNNNYYLGFINYDGYVTTMLSNGYNNIPTYDINSKKLTLMTSGYYSYLIR